MFVFNINLYSSTMEIIKKIIKRFKKWNAYWANIENKNGMYDKKW